jgi:alanyl-tRNA synthetase
VPQTVGLLVSTHRDPALVVLVRSGDLEFHAGNLLKEALAALGLRGGGSADLAQGQVPGQQIEGLLDALGRSIRSGMERANEHV